MEIFGPCGGAALYNRRMMLDLGGYDADFFAYLEDVDLAAEALGRLVLPIAAAGTLAARTFVHARRRFPFKRFLLGRNKVWLLAKNLPDADLWLHGPAMAGYGALAVSYGVAQRGDLVSLRGRLPGWPGCGACGPSARLCRPGQSMWRTGGALCTRVPPWQVPMRYAHWQMQGRKAAPIMSYLLLGLSLGFSAGLSPGPLLTLVITRSLARVLGRPASLCRR